MPLCCSLQICNHVFKGIWHFLFLYSDFFSRNLLYLIGVFEIWRLGLLGVWWKRKGERSRQEQIQAHAVYRFSTIPVVAPYSCCFWSAQLLPPESSRRDRYALRRSSYYGSSNGRPNTAAYAPSLCQRWRGRKSLHRSSRLPPRRTMVYSEWA